MAHPIITGKAVRALAVTLEGVREPVSSIPSRILVYGVTGSGKSVLAERIGVTLNLPWYAVDDLTWEPGWVTVPFEEQRIRISAICARECWVLDSAYGKWLDIPLARAELIVGLDYPRWFSLARLIRRTVRRMIRRDVVCNGNQESLRLAFSRDSIILWHFQSFKRKQRRMRSWRADPDRPRALLFRSPRAVNAWLHQLGEPGPCSPSSHRLASALATRLAPIVPDTMYVRSEGFKVVILVGRREAGGSAAAALVDDEDDRDFAERAETAVRAILNGVQDCVLEELKESWPPVSSGAELSLPGSRAVAGSVLSWYGDENAPTLRLDPIPLAELHGLRNTARGPAAGSATTSQTEPPQPGCAGDRHR